MLEIPLQLYLHYNYEKISDSFKKKHLPQSLFDKPKHYFTKVLQYKTNYLEAITIAIEHLNYEMLRSLYIARP